MATSENDQDIVKLLLIPLGTVLSYGVAFTYQSGHACYFGVPHEFVDVTLASGLKAALGVLSFFSLCFFWLNLPVTAGLILIRKLGDFWKRMAIVHLAILAAITFLLRAFGLSWSIFWCVILVLALLESLFILHPIIIGRLVERSKEPFATLIEDSYKHPEPPDILDLIRQLVGTGRFVYFVLCLILLGIGFLAGYGEARTQVTFNSLEESDFVCVGKYGTHFVFRKYDSKEQLYMNEFMALESSDMSSRRLKETLITNPRFEKPKMAGSDMP